jgi:hypothetical protein
MNNLVPQQENRSECVRGTAFYLLAISGEEAAETPSGCDFSMGKVIFSKLISV